MRTLGSLCSAGALVALIGCAPGDRAWTPAARDAQLRTLQRQRELWRAKGPSEYRIRYGLDCYCPKLERYPVVAHVRGDSVVDVADTLGHSLPSGVRERVAIYSVPELFRIAADGIRDSTRKVDITYDRALGYPTRIRDDSRSGVSDAWVVVYVDALRPVAAR